MSNNIYPGCLLIKQTLAEVEVRLFVSLEIKPGGLTWYRFLSHSHSKHDNGVVMFETVVNPHMWVGMWSNGWLIVSPDGVATFLGPVESNEKL